MEKNKNNSFPTSGPYFMAGTQQTGKYRVVAITKDGRVGYRELSNGCGGNSVRVRVEPTDEKAARKMAEYFSKKEWKQPGQDGQFRYSTVMKVNDAVSAIDIGLRAIGAVKKTAVAKALQSMRAVGVQVNPNAPGWAIGLLLETKK